MKIYQIIFNECIEDQYDSFIIASESEERAIKCLLDEHPPVGKYGFIDWTAGYEIKELNAEDFRETTIILESSKFE